METIKIHTAQEFNNLPDKFDKLTNVEIHANLETFNKTTENAIFYLKSGNIYDVRDGTISNVSGGTISRVYGGTISDVRGGTITSIRGGTITSISGGTIS